MTKVLDESVAQGSSSNRLIFYLRPVPPFRLDLTAWALRREPVNKLDRWDGETYRRDVVQNGLSFEVSVTQTGDIGNPLLEINVLSHKLGPLVMEVASAVVKRLLGTEVDLTDFYKFASAHKEMSPIVDRFRGVKPPRFLSCFEALTNGFVFQQISMQAGFSLLNHLVETYGPGVKVGTGHAFPTPEAIAGLAPEMFRSLGFSRQKATALFELASKIVAGLNLDQIEDMDDEQALDFLCQLRGVGRWTAQYVLLRGLGRLHVFPGDDVGAKNKLRDWLGLTETPDYEGVQRISAGWYPFGGMVYFHLLLNHLVEKGYLDA